MLTIVLHTPTWEQWAFIVASIALVVSLMSLPTAFQMFFGRPTIRFAFVPHQLSQTPTQTVLWCEITNPPLQNGVLRLLRVHRDPAEDVLVSCVLRDDASPTIVSPIRSWLAPSPDAKATLPRTVIPPTKVPFLLPIVTIDIKAKTTSIEQVGKEQTILKHGLYRVEVSVTVEGVQRFEVTAKLSVIDNDPYAYIVCGSVCIDKPVRVVS